MTRLLRLLSSSPPPPPAQLPLDQVNSDFIIILAALLCSLMCFLGLATIARCAWLRHISILSSSAPQTPHQNPPPESNKGLKKKVIKSLPTQPYTSEFTETDCAICLTELTDGDQLRVLPQCGHVFHVACIDTWLSSHSSCPSCRRIFVVGRCRKCGGGVTSETTRKHREDGLGQTTTVTAATLTADYCP